MKKILWIWMLLGTNIVFAQSLFPELAEFGGREKQPSKESNSPAFGTQGLPENMPEISAQSSNEESDVENNVKVLTVDTQDGVAVRAETEVDLFAPKTEKQESQTPVIEEKPSEKNENSEENVVIYMEAAKAVLPPGRNASYCFGRIKFSSTFNKPVQALDVVLTYGDYAMSYQIQNLQKDVEQTEVLGLVGESCALIMDMPQLEVKLCVVEGLSEDRCKEKVSFLPLRES